MKSYIGLAIIALFATPEFCASQGFGVHKMETRAQAPSVWLYWHNEAGTEAYSSEAYLDMACLSGTEPGWEGVWIDQDSRSENERIGCAYAYEEEDCGGNPGGIELTGLGDTFNKVPFDNPGPGFCGKSFKFSDAHCTGVGKAHETADSIVLPTAPGA